MSTRVWTLAAGGTFSPVNVHLSLDAVRCPVANGGLPAEVYVDDIAAAALKTRDINWFYTQLKGKFNAKPLGEIKKILGIRITRDRKYKTIYLD